jgi:hypothetical protein
LVKKIKEIREKRILTRNAGKGPAKFIDTIDESTQLGDFFGKSLQKAAEKPPAVSQVSVPKNLEKEKEEQREEEREKEPEEKELETKEKSKTEGLSEEETQLREQENRDYTTSPFKKDRIDPDPNSPEFKRSGHIDQNLDNTNRANNIINKWKLGQFVPTPDIEFAVNYRLQYPQEITQSVPLRDSLYGAYAGTRLDYYSSRWNEEKPLSNLAKEYETAYFKYERENPEE